MLDLQLVSMLRNAENVFVQLLAEKRRLFGQADRIDDVVRLVHGLLLVDALGDGGEGVLGENNLAIEEDVLRIDIRRHHEERRLDIPR